MNQLTSVHSPWGEKRQLAEDSAAEDSNTRKQLLNFMQEQPVAWKTFWCSVLGQNHRPSQAHPTAHMEQAHSLRKFTGFPTPKC